MDREHPGKKPGERRDRPGDWRDRHREATRSLATSLRGTFGYDDPTARRHLIAGVRLSLGGAPMADLERGEDDPDDDEAALATTARVYRSILDGLGFDRRDPVAAESFMVVVETTLDDMGLGWRTKVRKATDMVICLTCHVEGRAQETIRHAVLEHAREAVGPTDMAGFVEVIDVDRGDGAGPVPTEVSRPAGIFRLVFEIDRTGESSTEAFLAEVRRRLDEVLADPAILDDITRGPRKP